MANPFAVSRELRDLDAEIARQQQIISRAQTKLKELVARKRTLAKSLDRMIRRVERIASVKVEDEILRKVEKQINAEGWMERLVARRFTRQATRTVGGSRWEKLARETVQDRLHKGFPGTRPILVRTGALLSGAMAAAKGTFSTKHAIRFNIEDIDVPYAGFHQTGTDKIPSRRFFDSPTRDELQPTMNRMRALVRIELRKRMRGA